MPSSNYILPVDGGGWRVEGTRVTLDSIAIAYGEGLSPEEIALTYPSLSLEQVHGAIAFYLGNRAEVEQYLKLQDERWTAIRQESEQRNESLLRRLRSTRLQLRDQLSVA